METSCGFYPPTLRQHVRLQASEHTGDCGELAGGLELLLHPSRWQRIISKAASGNFSMFFWKAVSHKLNVTLEILFDEHVVKSRVCLWPWRPGGQTGFNTHHFLSPADRSGHWNPHRSSLELWLPGEVWWDWRGNKRLHGFPMDLLEHQQDLWTLWNQLTLAAGVKLFYTNTKQKKPLRYNKHDWNIKYFGLNKGINMSSYEINARNIFSRNKPKTNIGSPTWCSTSCRRDSSSSVSWVKDVFWPGEENVSIFRWLVLNVSPEGASGWLCSMCMWVLSASDHLGQINLS